jgi:hypothetical protein
MYGMVNKAMKDMITARHGASTWEFIRRQANIDVDVFVSNQPYPDEMTYNLVAAASQSLGIPAEQILESFGEHWVLETAEKGYGFLLKAGGNTFTEFLENLPNFHSRIALMYPDLKPPRFNYTDVTEKSLTFHYFSDRAGLAPFVTGLLKGLGKRFKVTVEVTQSASRDAGADHDEFKLRWS